MSCLGLATWRGVTNTKTTIKMTRMIPQANKWKKKAREGFIRAHSIPFHLARYLNPPPLPGFFGSFFRIFTMDIFFCLISQSINQSYRLVPGQSTFDIIFRRYCTALLGVAGSSVKVITIWIDTQECDNIMEVDCRPHGVHLCMYMYMN